MTHLSVGQVAADGSGIGSLSHQRAVIKTTGGDFNLRDAAVGQDGDLLRTGLAAVIRSVSKPVVEHIPLPVHALDAAVIGTGVVQAILIGSSHVTDITVGNDSAAKGKFPVGIFTRCIAQLVIVGGGINVIVCITNLADGASFKEQVFFVFLSGDFGINPLRCSYSRQHIIGEGDAVCATDPLRNSADLFRGSAKGLAICLLPNPLEGDRI